MRDERDVGELAAGEVDADAEVQRGLGRAPAGELFDGLEPGPFAELSYDAVYILKQVIEDADGKTDPETIRAGLNKLTGFDGLTGELTFTEQIHTTINKEQLTMVQWSYENQKWEPIE